MLENDGAGNVVRKRHFAARLVGDGTVGKGMTGKQAGADPRQPR